MFVTKNKLLPILDASENSNEELEMAETFNLLDKHLNVGLQRYTFYTIVGIDATILLGGIDGPKVAVGHEIIKSQPHSSMASNFGELLAQH